MSRLGRMLVDTARYTASDFAEDLVKQSEHNPPMKCVLGLQSVPSMIPCVAFAPYVLFPSAQANGLWKQS